MKSLAVRRNGYGDPISTSAVPLNREPIQGVIFSSTILHVEGKLVKCCDKGAAVVLLVLKGRERKVHREFAGIT
jgi:hypothetical protein